MEITPLEIFNQWFDEELKLTKVRIPTACCLSTIGTDNYPRYRTNPFVCYLTPTAQNGKK
ncbi:hypothetical protein SAMN05216269_11511 [Flavobacterium xinjiangense]|uniref:Pyridoxamine 5'-phosphate oxidase n=1 Tax=Flavobacterium xinjiangense TaxID=178356 RepID=A0A1M7P9W5_9FLAO|nr:hypothetical protein SAMN05216269_11511 [Flavobacterium xinjiangense]